MRKVFSFCLLCCFLSVFSFAQSTTEGAIGGTVFDTTGALVPNAQVIARNNGTSAEKTATANSVSPIYPRVPIQSLSRRRALHPTKPSR
jgi:hypothetical protein